MAQVVLMGVSVGPGPEDATLQPLHYRTSADGVIMTTVASTDMGRIFLGGGDGHLYELKYTVGGMQKVGGVKISCIRGSMAVLPKPQPEVHPVLVDLL